MNPQQQYSGGSPHPNYDFIFTPPTQKRSSLRLPGGNSVTGRVVVVLVGLLVLLILFSVVKNLINSGDDNYPALLRVAQNQQELIHLSAAALQPQGVTLSDTTSNSASTMQLSLISQQNQLIKYLATNHHKVSAKQLSLGVSSTVDTQLTAATTAGTYEQTLQQVLQTQLTQYEQSLKQAYNVTTGPNGRKLLNSDYTGAQLLVKQLGDPQG